MEAASFAQIAVLLFLAGLAAAGSAANMIASIAMRNYSYLIAWLALSFVTSFLCQMAFAVKDHSYSTVGGPILTAMFPVLTGTIGYSLGELMHWLRPDERSTQAKNQPDSTVR